MIAQCLSPCLGGSVCLGLVVQSIVSLTSLLLVKMLTDLVSTCTISNSQVFLPFNDQSFNDTLTNDMVSFEQLGPGLMTVGHLVK